MGLTKQAPRPGRLELARIREVEIRTKRLVNTLFSGDYKSSFKGRGIEFLDVREYLPGDDVRAIDWKVTARFGRPFVKKFAEERELVVLLVVDASGSARFGTRRLLKLEQAAQVAATLAFSAIRNNDKVGLVFFTDKVEKFVPPRKGRFHVLRLIRDILYFQPENRGTDVVQALEFLMHVLKRRAIVFLVSDFIGPAFTPERLRRPLGVAARRHDLVVLSVNDPAEQELPRLGLVEAEDAETGGLVLLDTSDPELRRRFAAGRAAQRQELEKLLRRLGVDRIEVSTDSDFTPALHKFFQARARRFR
uniref:DUF58 domain-containing protein n=1 Tax=candidate division WOR-3 bacterium TaxID=2052148 RepID=A0A7C4GC08_UNCW3